MPLLQSPKIPPKSPKSPRRKRAALSRRLHPLLGLALAFGATFSLTAAWNIRKASKLGKSQGWGHWEGANDEPGPAPPPPRAAAALFPTEADAQVAFCEAWRGTQMQPDPFDWVRDLGQSPFAMAVPSRPRGPAAVVARSLQRHGAWMPRVTADLLGVLENEAETTDEPLILDIGAGMGWFSLMAAAAGVDASAVALQPKSAELGALRRSLCVNTDIADAVAVVEVPEAGGAALAAAAAAAVAALGRGARRPTASVIHAPGRDALDAFLAGAQQGLWQSLAPAPVALVLWSPGGARNWLPEEDRSEAAQLLALALHKLSGTRFDVRPGGVGAAARPLQGFAALARNLVKEAPRNKPAVLWLTWRG